MISALISGVLFSLHEWQTIGEYAIVIYITAALIVFLIAGLIICHAWKN